MEAAILEKSIAIGLMEKSDYTGARNKLLSARKLSPGLEYVGELITVCDIICTSEFQLPESGIDWYWILQTNKTANESAIGYMYTTMVGILEPIKGKFPGSAYALELIKQAYDVLSDSRLRQEFDLKRTASWGPCVAVKPVEVIACAEETGTTSQGCSGAKRVVGECSDKSNLVCSAMEQPLKRVRSACDEDDCVAVGETETTSQGSSGSKRVVSECSDKSNLIRSATEQPLKRVRSASDGDDCVVVGETETTSQGSSGAKRAVSECSDKSNLIRSATEQPLKRVRSASNEDDCVVVGETETTSQGSSGSKRVVSECSDKSNLIRSATEQPLKRVRSASDEDDCVVVAEKQALSSEVLANGCTQEANPDSAFTEARFDKVEECLVSSSGSTCSSRKAMVHEDPTLEFYDFANNRRAEVFAVGQIWAAYDQEKMPRNYARINSIEKIFKKETNSTEIALSVRWLRPAPAYVDEKKWHEAGLPVCCGCFMQENLKIDKCNIMAGGRPFFSHLVSSFERLTNELVELHPREGEVWALYKDWKPYDWCSDPKTRKGCGFQLVEILTSYSKQAGVQVASLVKVSGFTSIFRRQEIQGSDFSYHIAAPKLFIFSHNIPAFRFAGEHRDLFSGMVFELDPFSIPEDVVVEPVAAKPTLEGRSSDACGSKHQISRSPPITSGLKSIMPKPKWPEEAFSLGQIWATYDGPDAMPRRYVIVHGVVSGGEVCVTCLEPHPELVDEISWVEQRLPFVCGSFRTGIVTFNLEVSSFSHLMKCESSSSSSNRYLHRIYPRKGEIWAMYKNWNNKWNRSSLKNYQCRIVEVLSDCSEDAGIRIASLIEVNGHKTFFHRQLYDGFELIRTVSMKELLSFSHQVPAFIVPGIENHGIPDGSWHLAPDALPAVSAD